MAGNGNKGGGEGPRIPRNLKPELESVNDLLQDISAKIASLHDGDKTFTLNIDIKNLDKFSSLEKSMKNASKINDTLSKSLGQRAKVETELIEKQKKIENGLKKNKDQLTELNKLSEKKEKLQKLGLKLEDDEIKRLEQLAAKEDDLIDSTLRFNRDLDEQKKQLEKLDGKWEVFAKVLGNQVLGALDKAGKALTALAIDSVFFSLEKMRDGFLKVYDLMERTTKAVGGFNLALGGTTAGLDSTRKEAFKVEGQLRSLTGGELGVGLKMWEETSRAIGFVGGDFDLMATKATLAGRALGIGGTAAGQLTRTFNLLGGSSADINKNIVEISAAANDAGVAVSDFGQEINSSRNFLASFGKQGRKTFLDSAAYAKRLGVSLQGLERFTDMTDTFSSTAEAAAKMNTVFGTSINSMELMLEQDPSKRIEMIRKQFSAQGKTFESMSRQERKFFAQTMNLSEEEAAGVLNSNMTLEEFQKKQADNKKKQMKDDEIIRRGLAKTAETLFNFGQAWDNVTAAVGRLLKPILKVFGLADVLDEKMSFGQKMSLVFGKLVSFIDKIGSNKKVQDFIQKVADNVKELFDLFTGDGEDSKKMWDSISHAIGEASEGIHTLYNAGEKVVRRVFTKKNLEFALKTFEFLADNIGTIVGGFLALKAVMGAGSIISGINGIVQLMSGGSGLIPILTSFGSAMSDIATKAFPSFISGFSKVGSALMSNVGSLTESIGGKLGVAGALAAAGLAGWEFGTKLREWFPQIDKAVQSFLDATTGFFDDLWRKIVHTSFYRTLFGNEAALRYDKADAAEAAFKRAQGTPVSPITTPAAPAGGAPSQTNYAARPAAAAKSGETKIVAGDVYLDGNLVGRHLLRGAGVK